VGHNSHMSYGAWCVGRSCDGLGERQYWRRLLFRVPAQNLVICADKRRCPPSHSHRHSLIKHKGAFSMLGRGTPWVAQAPKNILLLAFNDGCIARYRIHGDHLEYAPSPGEPWVCLSPEETLHHVTLGTIVGQWIRTHADAGIERE
jgi:hypothetical protein